jgi:hypothetical protein
MTFSDSTIEGLTLLLTQELDSAGYRVISDVVYTEEWNRIVDHMGGLYDPATGQRDDERLELARERLYQDLSELHQAYAVLYPEIWIVDAPFSDGVAQWDGTSEALVSFGTRVLDFLGAIFNSGDSQLPYGTVPALSLMIFVEDMSGAEVISNAGGIQVLEKVGVSPDEVSEVPDGQLLVDWARIRDAVRIALEPITEHP